MNRMYKIFLLFLSILALVSCVRNYTVSDYIEDSTVKSVEVDFVAADEFSTGDRIVFELYTRESCKKKPNFSRVAELESWSLINSEVKNVSVNLPVDKVLNVSVVNTMSNGSSTYTCRNFKSYTLMSNKHYIFKIRNRSTVNSSLGGFGCDFELYKKSINDNVEKISPVKADVPSC